MVINNKLRLCEVGGELGYFHCWEQYITTVGSTSGTQISRVYAVIEFPNRVQRVDPIDMKFVDETNHFLGSMNRSKKGNP